MWDFGKAELCEASERWQMAYDPLKCGHTGARELGDLGFRIKWIPGQDAPPELAGEDACATLFAGGGHSMLYELKTGARHKTRLLQRHFRVVYLT